MRRAELVGLMRRQHRVKPAFRGLRAWHADKVNERNVGDPTGVKHEVKVRSQERQFQDEYHTLLGSQIDP